MTTTNSVTSVSQQSSTTSNSIDEMDSEDFLKLLIAELENQDPLDPMSSQDMLNQVSQIREIASNTQLTESLEAFTLRQDMSTASNLIGRVITGLSNDATKITGVVDRVSVSDGEISLYVGETAVLLDNVAEISAETLTETSE